MPDRMLEIGLKLDKQREGQLNEDELKELSLERLDDLQKSVSKYLTLVERVKRKKEAKVGNSKSNR